MARVLANRLQLVPSDLIGLEQNDAVKGKSIQDNLYLVPQIDQHIVPQPIGNSAGEREAFGGVRARAVGQAGFPPVASSQCPRFGAPAP